MTDELKLCDRSTKYAEGDAQDDAVHKLLQEAIEYIPALKRMRPSHLPLKQQLIQRRASERARIRKRLRAQGIDPAFTFGKVGAPRKRKCRPTPTPEHILYLRKQHRWTDEGDQ